VVQKKPGVHNGELVDRRGLLGPTQSLAGSDCILVREQQQVLRVVIARAHDRRIAPHTFSDAVDGQVRAHREPFGPVIGPLLIDVPHAMPRPRLFWTRIWGKSVNPEQGAEDEQSREEVRGCAGGAARSA
jgi:hypothetical protein